MISETEKPLPLTINIENLTLLAFVDLVKPTFYVALYSDADGKFYFNIKGCFYKSRTYSDDLKIIAIENSKNGEDIPDHLGSWDGWDGWEEEVDILVHEDDLYGELGGYCLVAHDCYKHLVLSVYSQIEDYTDTAWFIENEGVE